MQKCSTWKKAKLFDTMNTVFFSQFAMYAVIHTYIYLFHLFATNVDYHHYYWCECTTKIKYFMWNRWILYLYEFSSIVRYIYLHLSMFNMYTHECACSIGVHIRPFSISAPGHCSVRKLHKKNVSFWTIETEKDKCTEKSKNYPISLQSLRQVLNVCKFRFFSMFKR